MRERLLITLAILASVWAMLSLSRRLQAKAAKRASQQLGGTSDKPRIVYFWSEGCHVCKNAQKRILEEVLAEYGVGRLELTTYNVDETPDIAKKWGVRTLPTTFLLDPAGTIRHINNGLAVSEILRKQLEPMIL